MKNLRVAVVGSGPSGAYCAQLLTEESQSPMDVDVFERLPAPFGLVRYGVAPDHPRIKSISQSFTTVFDEASNIRFLGNVEVGRDLSLDELREHYDAVIFASGAPMDRVLGVTGEDAAGVHAVRQFVSWYQGHPDSDPADFVLKGDRAVIVGLGNVALDAARMLMRTNEALRQTDIPEHIVEAFAASTFKEVVVVGRRGPAFAKFTNKEFLELLDLEQTDIVIDPADLELDSIQAEFAEKNGSARRLLASFAKAAERGVAGHEKSIRFVFDRTPLTVLDDGDGNVSAIELSKTSDPNDIQTLETQLVLRSVGYYGRALQGMPFDEQKGTIPHEDSRVSGMDGVYVAGWLKRGPNGVVGTNRGCALEAVMAVLADLQSPGYNARTSDRTEIDQLLASRDVFVVDWAAWKAIDEAELAAGMKIGRERVKLHSRDEMLRVAGAV